MTLDLPLPSELGTLDFTAPGFHAWLEETRERRRALRPLDRPQILIGASSVLAQPFVQACLDRGNVIALVDNASVGSTRNGVPVIGDADLRPLLAQSPDAIGILCCGSERAIDHFTAVWGDTPHPLIGFFEALGQAPGLVSGHLPAYLASFATLEGVLAAHAAGRAVLDDDLSLRTLDAIMLYRLTWDGRYIAAVAKPEKAIYFDPDVMPLHDHEVFIDGGAFDGDTIRALNAATAGKFAHAHAFELDPANADVFAAKMTLANVTLHRLGLWNEAARLGFEQHRNDGSHISHTATQYAELCALDDIDVGIPTLFKLDVEGAEVQAIAGAAELIRRHKPKLALSAYHRSDDLVTITNAVRAIRDDYTFSLRHYSPIAFDTVLYAL